MCERPMWRELEGQGFDSGNYKKTTLEAKTGGTMFKKLLFILSILLLVFISTASAAVTDYLILQDIPPYKLFTGIPGRVFSGPPRKYSLTTTGGILDAAGHFSENDVSYEASYIETESKWPFVKVEVTQHSGSETDKWLPHEFEGSYRDGDDSDGRLGRLSGAGVKIREIGGNRFVYWGLGGGSYTWVSGLKVIEIKYVDLQRDKPEPLEVVQAYLQKLPSTIPATLVLDKAHDSEWIKNEMDRRLWLCDKWILQIQPSDALLRKKLRNIVDHMKVFLDYREKYYALAAASEKQTLDGYLAQNDEASIRAKPTEYKAWWNANKGAAINLP